MTPEEEAYFNSHPAFAELDDHPDLPKVLLVGDSISIGYTDPVRQRLRSKANVHRVRANCHATGRGIVSLREWLGTQHWDLIVFNFGLHDVSLVKGEPRTRLGLYRNRLRTLIEMMRPSTRKIMWVNTTPVTPECEKRMRRRVVDEPHLFVRRDRDVFRYNEAARAIMDEQGIPIVDLYALALPKLYEIQIPRNVHFTDDGYDLLGQAVAEAIAQEL